MRVRIVFLSFLHSSAILGAHHIRFPPSVDTFRGLYASFRRLHTHKSEWIPPMHAPYTQPKAEVAYHSGKDALLANDGTDAE